jgi:hypothetical protein
VLKQLGWRILPCVPYRMYRHAIIFHINDQTCLLITFQLKTHTQNYFYTITKYLLSEGQQLNATFASLRRITSTASSLTVKHMSLFEGWNHSGNVGNRTLAGCGSGISESRTGSQLEWDDFCSLCGPSNPATMSSILKAHIAEPRRLFLHKDWPQHVDNTHDLIKI